MLATRLLPLVLPPKKLKGPIQTTSPVLGAAGTAPGCVDHVPQIASPQSLSLKIPANMSSPKLALSPVELSSAEEFEDEETSSCNSDSSSHYGSTDLANSEHTAHQPSPTSSAPADFEGPVFEVPATSPPGTSKSVPLGPWRNLFASNHNSTSGAQLLHYSEITATAKCAILNDDLDCACDVWKSCLIGYVSGRFPGFKALNSMIANTWHCEAVLNKHDSGWLIYKFQNEVDRIAVLKGGLYLVFGRPLILKEMPEFFDFNSAEMSTVPVWIKLPNPPLRCWSLKSLSKIASVVGKPIQSDMLTSSMSRLSYAHVLVEIDLRKTLPEQIDVSLPNGVVINQKVIYETLPKFCTFCNVIGHLVDSCSKLPKDLGGGFPHANDASLINKSPPSRDRY
ncbi:hypothetical protein OIU77_021002 [Salix suchowensis]|uniref:DUF4283 domain-containing protein n=1 Tax=Salix suchowensis TaxID=1278906 RepID=A0ABQ9CC65_9ROSI|nr:hypothetical protein OIU77_021002 [Salix suchowensis]